MPLFCSISSVWKMSCYSTYGKKFLKKVIYFLKVLIPCFQINGQRSWSKRRQRSDSQSSGKKEKSSFHILKKLFHGFAFTGVLHSQEPLLDTYSRFATPNFHVYVYGALQYCQKNEARKQPKPRLKVLVDLDSEVQEKGFRNRIEIFRQS